MGRRDPIIGSMGGVLTIMSGYGLLSRKLVYICIYMYLCVVKGERPEVDDNEIKKLGMKEKYLFNIFENNKFCRIPLQKFLEIPFIYIFFI